MTKQVKVFFVFLAVMAIISVFSFFDILGGVRSAKIFDDIKTLPLDVIRDADQDGLSDADESYWNTDFQNQDTDGDGFLDGEEVASGNDPREKADHDLGDSLADTVYGTVKPVDIAEDMNLTDEAGKLLVGAISAGDLTRTADENTQASSLDTLSLSVIDNFYRIQDILPIPTITVIDDSKDNQLTYLDKLYEMVQDDLIDFPQKLNTTNSLDSQLPYFSAKGEQFSSSLEKASHFSVPSDWVNIHKSILSILQRLSYNYTALANLETDVLKATAAFNEIANLNLEVKAIVKSVQTKANDSGLALNSNIYKILDILYQE